MSEQSPESQQTMGTHSSTVCPSALGQTHTHMESRVSAEATVSVLGPDPHREHILVADGVEHSKVQICSQGPELGTKVVRQDAWQGVSWPVADPGSS